MREARGTRRITFAEYRAQVLAERQRLVRAAEKALGIPLPPAKLDPPTTRFKRKKRAAKLPPKLRPRKLPMRHPPGGLGE